MDEYTFILLAKLKADRLKLQREQRAALRLEGLGTEEPIAGHRHSSRIRARARGPEMREPS